MVKKIKNLFYFICVIVFFSACVTDMSVELTQDNSIVMNGIIVPGDTITIDLYRSQQMNDSIHFANINNATVTLFIDGNEVENFSSTGNGQYQSKHIAQELTTYKVVVETENGETAWAETTTPVSDFGAYVYNLNELDSLKATWPYFLELNNKNGGVEKCWLTIMRTKLDYDSIGNPFHVNRMCYAIYTNSPYADKFNSTYDPEGSLYYYDFTYFLHIDIENAIADTVLIDFMAMGSSRVLSETVVVFNADDHYSSYLKSKIINEQGADYLTDNGPPINYKPAFLYSNVHGGMGILGSYTTYSKTYTYE